MGSVAGLIPAVLVRLPPVGEGQVGGEDLDLSPATLLEVSLLNDRPRYEGLGLDSNVLQEIDKFVIYNAQLGP